MRPQPTREEINQHQKDLRRLRQIAAASYNGGCSKAQFQKLRNRINKFTSKYGNMYS